jgi:hypothetical protein
MGSEINVLGLKNKYKIIEQIKKKKRSNKENSPPRLGPLLLDTC